MIASARHVRAELHAVVLTRLAELLFIQELVLLEVGVARLDDDVGLEVQDALEIAQRNVEEVTDAARQPLEEPHVADGCRQPVMWPRRSRRTFAWVTSTPHLSQITPRCSTRLYLPHRHSQSVTGPKIFAQRVRRAPA